MTLADVADLGRLVPNDAPHQGVVIEVEPLEDIWLDDILQGAGGARGPARPRPGHRSAQCRRHPALGGGIRSGRNRHPGPPFAAGKRSRRQGGLGRARARAMGAGRQPRPSARGDRRGGLLADRAGRRCGNGPCRSAGPAARRPGPRRRRRRACAPTRASIAMRSPACRSPTRSKASTSPTRPRSRFTRRASPDGPHQARASGPPSRRWPSREAAFARRHREARPARAAQQQPRRRDPASDHRRPAGQRRRGAIDVGQAGGRVRLPARPRPAARRQRRRAARGGHVAAESRAICEALPSWCSRASSTSTRCPRMMRKRSRC